MEGEIRTSLIQLIVLRSALKFEITTEGKARTQREPALSAYKRLIAIPAGLRVGRGQKGRIEALEVVEALLAQAGWQA